MICHNVSNTISQEAAIMALSFLSYTSTPHISQSRQSSENDKYAPLYGVWLMDLALHLG